MQRASIPVFLPLAVAFALSALAAGCQTSKSEPPAPEQAQVSESRTARAKVLSVERTSRLIVLQSQDGNCWVVRAGSAVRNFDQISAGDQVRVSYVASLAVQLKKPGEPIAPASATIGAARAEPGQTPAAGIGAEITATVKIESVDLSNNLVVFAMPSGELNVVYVKRPEGREFIRGLKRGDMVEITYSEAMAVALEKQ
jgi:hypothetical protein